MKLTAYDAFAGVGCFHLAAAKNGIKVVGACEILSHLQAQYQKNFGIKPDGDITKLKPADLPDFDVFFAGFPCTSWSNAGKRLGFNDPRGQLFFPMLDIIRAKQPKYFVLENVEALTTADNGHPFRFVLSSLESAGYAVNWSVVCPTEYGMPQRRRRVFIIGARNDIANGRLPDTARGSHNAPLKPVWIDKNAVKADWMKMSANQKRALDEWIRILSKHPMLPRMVMETYLTDKELEGVKGSHRFLEIRGLKSGLASHNADWKGMLAEYTAYGFVMKANGQAPTLRCQQPPISMAQGRYLTWKECCWLQSYPWQLLDGLSLANKYAAMGNCINVLCATDAVSKLGHYEKPPSMLAYDD